MGSIDDILSGSLESQSRGSKPKGLRDLWYSRGGTALRRFVGAVVYRFYRLIGEAFAVVIGLGIFLSWIAVSALDQQSTDLTILRPNIKTWFAEAFEGQDTEFGRLNIDWLPVDNHFVVTVEDVTIYDGGEEVLETIDLIQARFQVSQTRFQQPQLISAKIRGGVLSYIEDENGEVTIGLGLPDSIGRVGPVYHSNNRHESNTSMSLQDIDSIQINNAKIHLKNDISGVNIKANIDSLEASFSDGTGLAITAQGEVEQAKKPAVFNLSAVTETDLSRFKLRVDVKGARLDQIAPKKGRFWELQGIVAPVNIATTIDFSNELGLHSASVDLHVDEGHFNVLRGESPLNLPFSELRLEANLKPGDDRMDIERLDLSSPKLSFESAGFLTELGNLNDGDVNSSPVFDLAFKNIGLDITPMLAAPTQIKSINLLGQIDIDSRDMMIREGAVNLYDSVHTLSGQLTLTDQNEPSQFQLKTSMNGRMTPDQILSLWPVAAASGARRWMERSLISGTLNQLNTSINFDPAFFEDRLLTEERLKVHFSSQNANVQYMEFMPPALGVNGYGSIIGNQLNMTLQNGRIDDVVLTKGAIEIPRLLPKGGDLIIKATGKGMAGDLLAIVDNKPFEFATRYGVDPHDLEGRGNIELQVIRPLLEHFPRERITYQIDGEFVGAKAPFSIGEFDIKSDSVILDANRDRMIMTGPVTIGPWHANMRWQETFGDNPPPTQYDVSGSVDADTLDKLGIASRGWFDGSADVVVKAKGRGMNVSNAHIDIDLENTALSLENILTKNEGDTAKLVGQLTRDQMEGYVVRDAKLTAEGIAVQGSISLEADYRLKSLDLPEVRIENLVDGSLQIRPDMERSRLAVLVNGRSLDVSAWTQSALETRQSKMDVPFILSGQIDTLTLDPDYVVNNANLIFSHTGQVIDTARLRALSEGGEVSIELLTLEDTTRDVEIRIPDASEAVSAFLGLDNTTGGKLHISAKLPPAGEEGAFIGAAHMENFRLNRAPALAQLLSLASLTGLADTLSTGSMQFEKFTVPFTMLRDEISIRDARLYGPALGMTGDGDINLDLRVLDFDGTLVPAYSANSILGDIPLLGDLFIQEKDGGLFALTYTVSGPFEKTQININPLSALTPGFLRRIFKPDRTEVDAALREKIEDVTPKVAQDP